jgi:LysR family transcriptional regulator for metE and metH
VLDIVSRTEAGIKRGAMTQAFPLRLSTECYTVYHWLPSLLPAFRRAHPNVEVRIDAAATSDPVKALMEGRLDLALMTTAVSDRRLASQPLFVDEMRVIMAPTHRLAHRDFVRAQDFADETLLLYTAPDDSHVYQRLLVPAGVRPVSVQRVPLTEAIIELVKAGLGVAVLTEWTVAPYVRAGGLRARPLTRRGFTREWRAVTLAGVGARPYIRDFVELLRKSSPLAQRASRRPRSIGA